MSNFLISLSHFVKALSLNDKFNNIIKLLYKISSSLKKKKYLKMKLFFKWIPGKNL